MENKVIEVTCKGSGVMPLEDLREFQGNLKDLSDTDYARLKGEIIQNGFSFPIFVWKNEKQTFIIDGHQRKRVLDRMKQEGWEVPKIPVAVVDAKTWKEAKKKLLAATSAYGKITGHGLYEFSIEAEIDSEELMERFRLPEIDMAMWNAEFFCEPIVDTSASVDPTAIADYDGEKDTFSIRINDVSPTDKESVVDLVNSSLRDAGVNYKAEAF